MYRDIFARIAIPTAFGSVRITPLDHVELTDIQKRTLSNEPEEFEAFHDQFADVWDVEYGKSGLKPAYANLEVADRFINLSRLHLHAAAAIVTGGYDYRGAVQSSLLATELALKAGVAAQSLTEKQNKDTFGHDLDALVTFVAGAWPTFDANREGELWLSNRNTSRTVMRKPSQNELKSDTQSWEPNISLLK